MEQGPPPFWQCRAEPAPVVISIRSHQCRRCLARQEDIGHQQLTHPSVSSRDNCDTCTCICTSLGGVLKVRIKHAAVSQSVMKQMLYWLSYASSATRNAIGDSRKLWVLYCLCQNTVLHIIFWEGSFQYLNGKTPVTPSKNKNTKNYISELI